LHVSAPRVALFGLGRVGRAFLELLHERKTDVALVAVVDSRAALIGELDPEKILKTKRAGLPLSNIGGTRAIAESRPDVVVDLTSCDFRTGEPARSIIVDGIGAGAHVVTANKAPLARHWHDVHESARRAGVGVRYAAACGAALPLIAVASSLRRSDHVHSVEGVLTGTAAYVLNEMRSGVAFEDAVQRAQQQGIAEPDPSIDMEGWDSAAKLVLLANTLWPAELALSSVSVTGVAAARADLNHSVTHLMSTASFDGSEVRAEVRPEKLPPAHPLSSLKGSDKGVVFTGGSIGRVVVTGGRSHPRGAAAAAFGDMLAAIGDQGE
jgi:homoserine dehydrogenase